MIGTRKEMRRNLGSVSRYLYFRAEGHMPGKLRFRWTGPYWITREFNGSYQLGTLVGKVMGKWVNGFQLRSYYGPMPRNPFKQTRIDTTLVTNTTPASDNNQAADKQVAGKENQNSDRYPV